MPIPSKNKLQLPILELLRDEASHTITEVTDKLANRFYVSESERQQLTRVAKRPKFDVKVRWAVSELRNALLLENVKLGIFKITPRGLDVLKENPPIIDNKFLKKFPEYRAWLENAAKIRKIVKKKEKEKIKEKFGLVAYIDVLGTKELWKQQNSKNIPAIWNKFTRKFESILRMTMGNQVNVTFNSFSDTIIITLEYDDTDYLLTKFALAVWIPIVQSIELGIPIRGCFALGKFFHAGNFFIGEAITEAAEYYEMPQWIGISASPSGHAALESLLKKSPYSVNSVYFKCSIPLKNSIEQEAWAVKWPDLLERMNSEDSSSYSTFKNILDIIDASLENVTNVDVALKWRNTKKFYDDVVNNVLNRSISY